MRRVLYHDKEMFPSKVICIGRNYVEHIKELNNETPDSMVIFNKPNSAITERLYYFSETTRFEGEICFLIKDDKIDGIGFGLDLTHADIQNKMKAKGLPWERAKAFDKSAVLSSFVKFDGDMTTLEMKLFVNTKLVQHATYDLMIYKPDAMLSEISSFMSFEDGDIIMSGTPKGVGTYQRGDIFEAEIRQDGQVLIKESFTVI